MSSGDGLIADQIAYYRARAGEYDDNLRQLDRYLSLGGGVTGRPGAEESKEIAIVLEALESMRPFDTVLELACGTGWWTQWLAEHARSVTAAVRCHDCNVKPGGVHHGGCDEEVCARCGGQLIMCPCRGKRFRQLPDRVEASQV